MGAFGRTKDFQCLVSTEGECTILKPGLGSYPTSLTILFFIPGNPGLTQYYSSFYRDLALSLPTFYKYLIYAPCLLGFGGGTAAPPLSPLRPLEEHTLHLKTLLLKQVVEALRGHSKINLILIGHSVGAYLALSLVKDLTSNSTLLPTNTRLAGLILLTPTIADLALSSFGRVLATLLELPGAITMISGAAWTLGNFVPGWLRIWLIKVTVGGPANVQKAHQGLLERGETRSALQLARDEMRTIKDPDWADGVLREWGGKWAASFAENVGSFMDRGE
ncbi:MAG: hypothetical protein M1814_006212 [Vezdaea aestivalis]|nr:MAG: hypothetical protein M1814_006212 [Vezdaea aestivalis]